MRCNPVPSDRRIRCSAGAPRQLWATEVSALAESSLCVSWSEAHVDVEPETAGGGKLERCASSAFHRRERALLGLATGETREGQEVAAGDSQPHVAGRSPDLLHP